MPPAGRLAFAFVAAAAVLPALAQAADGPSFDCARVSAQVTRMICASAELAALDRRLAEHFRALQAQPGTDGAALRREEDAWLREVRNPCADEACVKQAYLARDAELLARSRRTAGPAAVDESRPFAVDPGLWVEARGLRGTACIPGGKLLEAGGYAPVPGASTLAFEDGLVIERRRQGADFAFLIDTRHGGCRVADVVALPPRATAGTLLQCRVPAEDGGAGTRSAGVGLRRPGHRTPLAYWEVAPGGPQFVRQPLEVLGWTHVLRCRPPEAGE
jgi:uncharacterized protein YecT (DUF1311 family)